MSMPSQITPPSPSDAAAITDALYRAVLGIDTNDLSLFKSAFVTDGSASATMMGTTHSGTDAIIANVFRSVGPLDTTHFVSNVRVNARDAGEGKAKIYASAQAFHYRPGEGVDPSKTERLVSGGLYDVDVKRQWDGTWRVQHWGIRFVWLEGNMAVITG
ncbi:uncharacterized protein HMPREF1541_00143 [Cyphellophora europaea CBS 101466]|uniref:SnoaL-like domain-containing protein n=1 Tax=Cyphellophora europaea (strain CBS 101466) TaxID=1220924 RepID=W2SB63_CYPE1|nr:uncharacterized protein HMPREF1541_00143 [Cyphellophora europaea CBS 101466]ETN45961.1 hypothetical protein HMPREF1541_00143 [Cyphellophora europaea CBS 101466]